jgi:hypothetical protein
MIDFIILFAQITFEVSMLNKPKVTTVKKAGATEKPQVHWGGSTTRSYKIETLSKKSQTDKKAKTSPINEEGVKKFIIDWLTEKDFTGLKAFLEKRPLKEQLTILSVSKFAPFKWAAMNCEVEALSFIVEMVPNINARYMMYDENYEAIKDFIRLQRGEELMGTYNQEIRIEGFKIFAKIDYVALGEVIGSSQYSKEKIKNDFIQAIEELKDAGEVDIDDKYLSEIKAKFGYTAADTTDEDTNSDSSHNTSGTTEQEDTEMSSNTPPESTSNLAQNDATQADTNSLAQDSDLGSKQPLSLHVNREQHVQSSEAKSSTDDLASLILNYYLSWLKDLPEWLQEQFMHSSVMEGLMEAIESIDPRTIFEMPDDSKQKADECLLTIYEELAQTKIEQSDIEVPEDLEMANWLFVHLVTLG